MSPERFDHLSALVKLLIKKKDTNLRKSISADFQKDFKKIFKNTWEGVRFLAKFRGYNIYFTGIEFLCICFHQTARWKKSRNSILTLELWKEYILIVLWFLPTPMLLETFQRLLLKTSLFNWPKGNTFV